MSHNHLDRLPDAIQHMTNLELLDISFNQLASIDQIKCMPALGILNVSGNSQLRRLPPELSTCDSLVDIIVDVDNIEYPPRDIVELGTREILNYLIVQGGNMDGIEKNDQVSTAIRVLAISNKTIESNQLIHEEREIRPSANNRSAKESVSASNSCVSSI